MLPQEPLRGVFSYLEYPGLVTLSGLEQTRLFAHAQVPAGPLTHLTGLKMTDFGLGSATFRLPCTGWLRSPAGLITGGVLALAVDGALATAIHTAVGPRRVPTTSDLMLNFVSPPDSRADAILVRAELVHLGAAQALSQAVIQDSDGRLLGTASTRCLLLDIPGDLPGLPPLPIPPPVYDGPDPFQRPCEGAPLSQATWNSQDGLQLLHGWRDGSLSRSPLSNLLGAQVESAQAGQVVCSMPASAWFCSLQGALYGGALALFADYAMLGAVQSTQPAGSAWATLDLNVRFVRQLRADGSPIRAHAHVRHQGRRMAVTSCTLSQGDQEPAVLADSSVLLLPNRPWSDVAALTDEPHRDLDRTHDLHRDPGPSAREGFIER